LEAVLSETTNTIDIVYQTLSADAADTQWVDGTNATVGLQDNMGIASAVHTGTVSTAAAIRFTPR
jgi:hypothetical protein